MSNNIAKLRVLTGYSQTRMGSIFGVSQPAVSMMLSGKLKPSGMVGWLAHTLVKLGEVDPALIEMALSTRVDNPRARIGAFYGVNPINALVYLGITPKDARTSVMMHIAASLDLIDALLPAHASRMKGHFNRVNPRG